MHATVLIVGDAVTIADATVNCGKVAADGIALSAGPPTDAHPATESKKETAAGYFSFFIIELPFNPVQLRSSDSRRAGTPWELLRRSL